MSEESKGDGDAPPRGTDGVAVTEAVGTHANASESDSASERTGTEMDRDASQAGPPEGTTAAHMREILDTALATIADAKVAPTRCALATCRKKIPLTRTACACGKTFCTTHAFFTAHGCDVDYKQREADEARRQRDAKHTLHGTGSRPSDSHCAF